MSKHYLVETRVLVRRHYRVVADDPQSAQSKIAMYAPLYSEDENEEVDEIRELPDEASD